MKVLRYIAAVFVAFWCIAALCYAFMAMVWSEATLTRLNMPQVSGLGSYADSVKLEVFAADGSIMYRKHYSYGGRLELEDDIDIPIHLLNSMREDYESSDESRFTFWQRLLFKMERIDPDTLESFIRDYYARSLTDVSKLKGFKKELLRYHVMKKLYGTYGEKDLYYMYFDSVHYASSDPAGFAEIHGIVGAARAYFDKNYSELNPLELSFLVAKAVSNPAEDVVYHDRMARHFLSLLHQDGYLDNSLYRELLESKLEFALAEAEPVEPYIVNIALAELEQYTDVKPGSKDIVIRTHYNPRAVEAAKKALEPLYAKDPKVQAAFVMVNAATGGIEAAVGSRVDNSHRNRVFSSRRQMGSTFKPIVYATALQQGMLPCEHIVDRPYSFKSGKTAYNPGNYRDVFLGSIPMRYGLVYSLNNATVYLAQRTGLSRISKNAVDMGFDGDIFPYYAMALGSFSTTPLSVAEMYSTFANYGTSKKPVIVNSILYDGNTLPKNLPEPKQVFDEVTAYQTMYIMQEVCTRGTARGAKMLPGTAAKTGTSDHSKDVWTVTINYPYVIVLWVGYDDYKRMDEDLSGGNTAAPVIAAFQKEYFGTGKSFTIPVPAGVKFEKVRSATGLIANGPGRGRTYTEAFREGQYPKKEK